MDRIYTISRVIVVVIAVVIVVVIIIVVVSRAQCTYVYALRQHARTRARVSRRRTYKR